ncbi:hypothetical protein ACPWT1_00150 [Ramlibacter sp. MMS24-I3-19]|uniref:hypothetical protein n=1 Tax=Ramlibacter sp. MMS24-I3-19 TaxID=3416606 RepID=UPI003D081027
MHAPSLARLDHLRTWIVVAVVLAVIGLMALVWDSRDLGDGLVRGTGGSVSAVWETAQGDFADLLSSFTSPATTTAESGR